ncbi:ABC transporter substrate-binding protein [Mycoplasmopsis verecunda]|uniref:Oligopeptide transport system substrate-binding protein n=1 Tax=Mycoplasmopsis verecunda TaxID=171291 RepID=A0A1T4LP63_9BACT|nr:ABC transporter substrate-binding protein [Mycoplasmopsis verecunda]WPB54716.1 ABC transporter substrate-binding protein [Mycoplasmopsis verecunda]SJZ56254.1 oligopeptide transport system substrate-binding protein [Mycoplasmopsis verecunda]
MNKKIKKLSKYLLFSSAPLAVLTSTAAACAPEENKPAIEINYDLGLATEPINNLNYVKYKSMDKIVPSLVDSFLKNGPTTNLKRVLPSKRSYNLVMMQMPEDKSSANFEKYINSNKSELLEEDGRKGITGSYYSVDNFMVTGGLADDSSADPRTKSTMFAFRNPRNTNNYMALTGFTNPKKNRWSNGDYINAQDIRDYLEYILDLNTGSQKLDQIKKFGFRAADKFIDAQKDYLTKFNKTYKNPFGRRKYKFSSVLNRYIQDPDELVYQSQTKDSKNNPLDGPEVQAIKQAAAELGFYTGQLFLDFDNEFISKNLHLNKSIDLNAEVQDFKIQDNDGKIKTIKIVRNPYVMPYQDYQVQDDNLLSKIKSLAYDQNSFTIIFDENHTPDLSYLVFTILFNLYPINRKYVETEAGGIDTYGSQPEKFLTSGPFIIPKGSNGILLGPNGYINLEKDKEYFDAENTISNKIKIMFSTNRNTNALFFEDGYISQTYIPASKMISYWADDNIKQYLNKNQGYGTIAFGFNLDRETNGDSWLQDQDLRNAIYFAINRDEALKFVGWDFSFPVTTWTAYGQYRTFDGKNLEMFFEGAKSKTKDGSELDLQNYEYVVHMAKGFNFEKTQRRDLAYRPKTAKYYIEQFKKKHPEVKQVTLQFLNNGQDEQKRAGQYLKEAMQRAFGDFVQITLKSLPENIFADFIEKGTYDIIYQNYDRIGGNGAQDYVSAFFKKDEIDTINQKTIAFKENPVGSYTYADYVSDLVIEELQKQDPNVTRLSLLQPDINEALNIINTDAKISKDFAEVLKSNSNIEILKFNEKYASKIKELLSQKHPEITNRYSDQFVRAIIDIILLQKHPSDSEEGLKHKNNVKSARIHSAFNIFLPSMMTIQQIADLTNNTQERLEFNQDHIFDTGDNKPQTKVPPKFWNKFIELALPKFDETAFEYTSRLSSFFSGNFSNEEIADNWEQHIVYQFIGALEKVIRDASMVVPLMEVDTNWEVTKVGGVDSLFRFSLQYAYDMTRPPRNGLPVTREG